MFLAGRSYHELEIAYRKRLWRATLGSTAFVGLLAILVPPSCVPHTERMRAAGYREALEIREVLAPADFPTAEIAATAAHRISSGALEWVDIEWVDEEPSVPRPPPQPQTPVRENTPAESPAEVVIELDENFAPRTTSLPKTRSSEFALLKMKVPDYPPFSLQAGVEGLVTIMVWVNTSGGVQRVMTLSNGADYACQAAAEAALTQWSFRPLEIDGQAIQFCVEIPFRFRIE